jgi:secreted trypsin-like serine protease
MKVKAQMHQNFYNIGSSYVLTSAHCISGRSISSFLVAVGEHDFDVRGDGEQFVHVQVPI